MVSLLLDAYLGVWDRLPVRAEHRHGQVALANLLDSRQGGLAPIVRVLPPGPEVDGLVEGAVRRVAAVLDPHPGDLDHPRVIAQEQLRLRFPGPKAPARATHEPVLLPLPRERSLLVDELAVRRLSELPDEPHTTALRAAQPRPEVHRVAGADVSIAPLPKLDVPRRLVGLRRQRQPGCLGVLADLGIHHLQRRPVLSDDSPVPL